MFFKKFILNLDVYPKLWMKNHKPFMVDKYQNLNYFPPVAQLVRAGSL